MKTNLDNIISKINKLHKFYESAKKINSEEEAIQWYLESNDISLDYLADYVAHYHEVEA